MAAGEEVTREARDVLGDVRGIYKPGERGLHWQQIAARLADAHPEHYADLTADAISAQIRAFGVPSVDVKRHGVTLKGARAEAINTAIQRRADR